MVITQFANIEILCEREMYIVVYKRLETNNISDNFEYAGGRRVVNVSFLLEFLGSFFSD